MERGRRDRVKTDKRGKEMLPALNWFDVSDIEEQLAQRCIGLRIHATHSAGADKNREGGGQPL